MIRYSRGKRPMNNDEIIKLLKEMFQSEEAPPLTDVEVDAFLALNKEEKSSAEFIEKARGRLAEKMFARAYSKPVRSVKGARTFGQWIKGLREQARVGRMAAAFAVRQDTSFIDRLESGSLLPWKLPADDTALLMKVYRIHYEAVSYLIRALTAVKQPGLMLFNQGSSTSRIDAGPGEPPLEIVIWLNQLRRILEKEAPDLVT